jgi:hypothetical protein
LQWGWPQALPAGPSWRPDRRLSVRGELPSSRTSQDPLRSAAADHDGRGIRGAGRDCRHDGRVGDAQPADVVDAQVGVHDGIRVGPDLRGADGVPKAGRPGPCELQQILLAGIRTRNHLGFADGVERGLTTQLPRCLNRAPDGAQVMVCSQMVALDDGSIAPIGARQAYASATGRLNERRRDRKAFLRRSPEARSRLRRRDR